MGLLLGIGNHISKNTRLGSKLSIPVLQEGYWVHKDTGVKTYFDLTDPSIEDGIMGYPSWMPNCSEVKLPSGVTGFKTYNWVFEEMDNMEIAYTGFVHTKETILTGNDVLIGVDLSNTSISSIGSYAFFACSSLTSITLPESVVSLGEDCFYYCASLTLAIVLPATPPSMGRRVFDSVHSSFNIKVRSPYVNDYKAATRWIDYASKISAI